MSSVNLRMSTLCMSLKSVPEVSNEWHNALFKITICRVKDVIRTYLDTFQGWNTLLKCAFFLFWWNQRCMALSLSSLREYTDQYKKSTCLIYKITTISSSWSYLFNFDSIKAATMILKDSCNSWFRSIRAVLKKEPRISVIVFEVFQCKQC